MVGVVDAQLARTGGYIAGEQFTADRYYERLLERTGFVRYGRDGGP